MMPDPSDVISPKKIPDYTPAGRFHPDLSEARRVALVKDLRRGKRKFNKFKQPVGTTTLLWDSNKLGTKRGSFP